MTVYAIGKLVVKDWQWYKEYRSVTEPLVAEYGGHYLVKGGEPEKLEGEEPVGHAWVVMAFPDRQAIRDWYGDPRYAKMIALRHESEVLTDLVVLDQMPSVA